MINPLLRSFTMPIKTNRLLIRQLVLEDAYHLHKIILLSFEQLSKWLPWAKRKPTIEDTQIFIKTAQAKWLLAEDLALSIFDLATGELLGATGFHRINWSIPSIDIGYWIRSDYSNQGIITESTYALVQYAIKEFNAKRITISCDEDNYPSRRVAEKCGFILEGILHNHRIKNDKTIGNTALYAFVSALV